MPVVLARQKLNTSHISPVALAQPLPSHRRRHFCRLGPNCGFIPSDMFTSKCSIHTRRPNPQTSGVCPGCAGSEGTPGYETAASGFAEDSPPLPAADADPVAAAQPGLPQASVFISNPFAGAWNIRGSGERGGPTLATSHASGVGPATERSLFRGCTFCGDSSSPTGLGSSLWLS